MRTQQASQTTGVPSSLAEEGGQGGSPRERPQNIPGRYRESILQAFVWSFSTKMVVWRLFALQALHEDHARIAIRINGAEIELLLGVLEQQSTLLNNR